MAKVRHVGEYIAGFPEYVQLILNEVRNTIKDAAPEAEEGISYGMPAYRYCGMLVYFAGYKKHIGFYAAPSGHTAFAHELRDYKKGKGSVQFPLDKPIPLTLISDMVKFRVKENRAKLNRL